MNNPNEKVILQVVLRDNNIYLQINSNHIPSLCFANKLISVEIDKMIINNKIKEQEKNSAIITPSKGGIINFIRGKNANR